MRELPAFLLRLLVVTALTAGSALLVSGRSRADRADRNLATPKPGIGPAQSPIAAEAQVFGSTAYRNNSLDGRRRNTAHPRTLATFRALRAYDGAPPRVPHGLTTEEFRTTRCKTCHERGGYAMRFQAYAPVTPHPQLGNCLQCHLTDDAVVGAALPANNPDGLCRQCHNPGAAPVTRLYADWGAAERAVSIHVSGETPPVIPHDLEMRADCLACHAGPGAVEEIRTRHPERTNCRQCHLAQVAQSAAYTRGRSSP